MSAALSYLSAALLWSCALVVSLFALGVVVWAALGNRAALARMERDSKMGPW